MSSVAQVALGVFILGAAFVFGSHIRNLNQDKSSSPKALEPSSESELVWQRTEQLDNRQQPASDSGGLIDLPVAKRRVATANNEPTTSKLTQNNSFPSDQILPTKSAASADNPDDIQATNLIQSVEVEPDFSDLEMSFANKSYTSPVNKPMELANRVEFVPAQPLYRSSDRDRVQKDAANLVGGADLKLGAREDPTLTFRGQVETIEPSAAPSALRRRVPFDLTPLAKSRLVRLPPARTNQIQLETESFANHITRAGDSLHLISKKYFGTPDYYLDIYLANQDQLDSPANVPPGTNLRIPIHK